MTGCAHGWVENTALSEVRCWIAIAPLKDGWVTSDLTLGAVLVE